MQRYPMTAKGAQDLREELDRLKRTERPAVITRHTERCVLCMGGLQV